MASEQHWTKSVDVVVVGCGYAGANAAIAAHDAGAQVLVLEKMPRAGGISICSGGGIRVAKDADSAFAYLRRTNGDTAPDDTLRALAEGMTQVTAHLAELAKVSGATLSYKEAPGLYPFEGCETFGFSMIESIPDFDPAAAFPQTKSLGGGAFVFKVLQDNLEHREIELWMEAAAQRLITDANGRVVGIRVMRDGSEIAIEARRGVILACGGFEADPRLQAQYWHKRSVPSCGTCGITTALTASRLKVILWGFAPSVCPIGIQVEPVR